MVDTILWHTTDPETNHPVTVPLAPGTEGEPTPAAETPAPAPVSSAPEPASTAPAPLSAEQLADQLYRERTERLALERQLAEAQTEQRLREAGWQPPAPQPEAPDPTVPLRPEEYASDPEYWQAELDRRFALLQQQQAQQAQRAAFEQQQAARGQAFLDRTKAFQQQQPDYEQVIAQHLRDRLTQPVIDALTDDEQGPALAYHVLARDPALVQQLNQMTVTQAARALGALTARLPTSPASAAVAPQGSEATPPPPATAPPSGTAALPRPPPPLGGGAPPASTTFVEGDSQREFERKWKALYPHRP